MKNYICDKCGNKFDGELEDEGDIPWCDQCTEDFEAKRKAREAACEHDWLELVDSHSGEPCGSRRCNKCSKQEWRQSKIVWGDY